MCVCCSLASGVYICICVFMLVIAFCVCVKVSVYGRVCLCLNAGVCLYACKLVQHVCVFLYIYAFVQVFCMHPCVFVKVYVCIQKCTFCVNVQYQRVFMVVRGFPRGLKSIEFMNLEIIP